MARSLHQHDPALAEALRHEPEDDLAVVVRLGDPQRLPKGARIITRFGDIATVRIPAEQLEALAECEAVLEIEAVRDLRIAGPAGLAAEADPSSVDGRRPAGLTETGHGVVLGVVDYGIDFTHPAFRNPDGSTRIRALWDQRSKGGTDGNRWGYGRVLTRTDIDAALASSDPVATLAYDPADSDQRDRNGKWSGAHGTHVLSIAAGTEGGAHTGVAPGAELVCVHLARTRPALGRGNLGDSASVLEGLDFLFEQAGARPVVVNMSVGAHGGPHDGSTLVEQGIDQALSTATGRAVVQSAGNYFARGAHTHGTVSADAPTSLPFDVPAGDPTPSEIEVYYSASDRFTAEVVGPDGSVLCRVAPGEDVELRLRDVRIGHAYHVRRKGAADHHVDVFLDAGVPAGRWALVLHGDTVHTGRFHAWIERDDGGRALRFPTSVATTETTTGTLCNGKLSIAVGAYAPHPVARPLGSFSSSGPTRDGRPKPDLVAPGVAIVAAQSRRPGDAGGRSVAKQGTSMAAPHVTGTIALMFEAAGRPLAIAETRALLLRSASAARVTSSSQLHRVGHGYLDIAGAVAAARSLGTARPADDVTLEGDLRAGPPLQVRSPPAVLPAQPHQAGVAGLRVLLMGLDFVLGWLGDRAQQQRVQQRLDQIEPAVRAELQRKPGHGALIALYYRTVPSRGSMIHPVPTFAHARWAAGRTRSEARDVLRREPTLTTGPLQTSWIWLKPSQAPRVSTLRRPFPSQGLATFAAGLAELQDVRWGGALGFDDEGRTGLTLASGRAPRLELLAPPPRVAWFDAVWRETRVPIVRRSTARGPAVDAVDLDPGLPGFDVAAVPVFPADGPTARLLRGAPPTRDDLGQLDHYVNVGLVRWVRPEHLVVVSRAERSAARPAR